MSKRAKTVASKISGAGQEENEEKEGESMRVVRDGGDQAKKGLDKCRLLPFPWLSERYF
jgi:hypothetical protein